MIREKRENPLDSEEQQERESSPFLLGRKGDVGEVDGKRCTEPRGVVLQPALGSLTYAEPPLHAISTTILRRLAPFALRPTEHPPFRPRCTVAFGLCIIITITTSSSWLVVEKPPLGIFSPSLSISPFLSHFRFASILCLVFVRKREVKKRNKGGIYGSRVCVN